MHKIRKFYISKYAFIQYAVLQLLLSNLSCQSTLRAGSQNERQEGVRLDQVINAYFANCRLMKLDDLEPFTKAAIMKGPLKSNPFYISEDFDGNGFPDMAFLMKSFKKNNSNTIFVILLQLELGTYNTSLRVNMGFNRNDVFIKPIDSGTIVAQTRASDQPSKQIRVNHPSVELFYFEKSSVVYYWDDKTGQFSEIWTSD